MTLDTKALEVDAGSRRLEQNVAATCNLDWHAADTARSPDVHGDQNAAGR